MFWLLLLTVAAITVVYTRWQRRGIYKLHAELPLGIPTWPFVGHGYLFRGTNEDRMKTIQRVGNIAIKQNGLTSIWMGQRMYGVIADPKAIEVVAKACLSKDNNSVKHIRTVIGNANVFAPGSLTVNIWRPRRKIMAPTFNLKNLQQFVKIFENKSSVMVDLLGAQAGGGDFSIWPYMTTYTFDAVCESALGVNLNSQKDRSIDHPFIHAFDVMTHILAERILLPWLYWDWLFYLTPRSKEFSKQTKLTKDFFDQIIRDRRRQLANSTNDNCNSENGLNTFLDMLIETSGGAKGYSDLELREETMNIVMAGTDTSAVGSSFTALMLARHPDVQEKAYQELREVFGDSDRQVTWEDLPKLKYLEVIIKETLRLYPPVPITVREVLDDETNVVLPSGTRLVPGMALVLHVWATHRNAEYWGADADQFRPERFCEGPLKHPAQYIPFSYSLRNCAGSNYAMMSMKTNLARLLRRYRVLPPASLAAADVNKPLRVEFDIMMRDVDNFQVRIEHRNKN